MSIICASRIAQRLQSMWFVPLYLWLLTLLIWVATPNYPEPWSVGLLIIAGLLVIFSVYEVIQWKNLQKAVIRFNNVREALTNGHIIIATYSDDTLREIADAVSDYLSQLGIDHAGAGEYAKHIVIDKQDHFSQVRIDNVLAKAPDDCKLSLIIAASIRNNGGVTELRYCLVDNSGKSVIILNHSKKWPYAHCGDSIPATQIAKEIVSTLFESLNLTIRAATAPDS